MNNSDLHACVVTYTFQVHRFGKQFNRDGKVPEAKLGVEFHSVHVELDPTLLDRLDIIKKIPSLSRQSSSPDSFDKDSRSLYLPMSNANLVCVCMCICLYTCMYVCIL